MSFIERRRDTCGGHRPMELGNQEEGRKRTTLMCQWDTGTTRRTGRSRAARRSPSCSLHGGNENDMVERAKAPALGIPPGERREERRDGPKAKDWEKETRTSKAIAAGVGSPDTQPVGAA